MNSELKLLFVTQELNWPLRSGGEIRQWQTLRALHGGGVLDVVVFQPQGTQPPPAAFEGCRKIHTLDASIVRVSEENRRRYRSTAGRFWLTITDARPFEYQTQSTAAHSEWFRQLVRDEDYDAIWFSKAVTALSLGWKDRVRTIVDGDDFDSVREYNLLINTPWYGAKFFNYINLVKLALLEVRLQSRYAYVARCSEEDRRRLPRRNVAVVPNGTVIPKTPLAKSSSDGSRVLFVGTLSYPPNVNGLLWFLRQVWPEIRQKKPDARLDIAGGGVPPSIQEFHDRNGVVVHGFVEDLTALWQSASLSIAPILAGGGTRMKILESLGNSTRVVSTPIGAYGLGISSQQGVICEAAPSRFANACVELLNDPLRLRDLGQQGFTAVSREYDWNSIHEKMRGLAAEVARNYRARR